MTAMNPRASKVNVPRAALWPLALVCAIATAWGLVHVYVRLQLIAVGYEISRQTQLRHDLTELAQRLSIELRTRMDLGTVERLARERLQMVPLDPQQVRQITATGGPRK